ncbi:hypothetical protein B0T16DRAFT_184669 [Cercophora newfieldiana]|uniref:Developmental regulator n=1 Tax=Cercophora newfieldiana TaxID=92897 RepID=A0AA39Y063_9PEZI|nr:hypothetical protein B0T16DRAFT_184669 [Cercophora newfieldiana]
MPAYLCHGFRWKRASVRVFIIVQDLDDASPEWIVPAKSATCILEAFYNVFDFLPYHNSSGRRINSPTSSDGGNYAESSSRAQSRAPRSRSQSQSHSRNHRSGSRQPSRQRGSEGGHGGTSTADFYAQDWSPIKVLEEYDPMILDEISRPYAYVADYVVPVTLSVDIAEEMQKYEDQVKKDRDPPIIVKSKKSSSKQQTGWFEKLRDQLQDSAEIRWYVVANGDEVRDWPDNPGARPTPTQQQQAHHAQYMNQQRIFKENERAARGLDPRGRSQAGRDGEQKPMVPEKDLPPIQSNPSKMSADSHDSRPKTPKRGGLRRLFGRGKGEGPSSP